MDAKTYKYFKVKYALQERIKDFEKQKSKYPHMIPVIVEISKKAEKLKMLEKYK